MVGLGRIGEKGREAQGELLVQLGPPTQNNLNSNSQRDRSSSHHQHIHSTKHNGHPRVQDPIPRGSGRANPGIQRPLQERQRRTYTSQVKLQGRMPLTCPCSLSTRTSTTPLPVCVDCAIAVGTQLTPSSYSRCEAEDPNRRLCQRQGQAGLRWCHHRLRMYQLDAMKLETAC